MARLPRKRLSLSFSEGHRLAPAFKALGYDAVPSAAEVRRLLELGLAAQAAGLLAVADPAGVFHLVRPLSEGQGIAPARAAPTAAAVGVGAAGAAPSAPSAPEPAGPSSSSADDGDVAQRSEKKIGAASAGTETPVAGRKTGATKVSKRSADNERVESRPGALGSAAEAADTSPEPPPGQAADTDEASGIDDSTRELLNAALQF